MRYRPSRADTIAAWRKAHTVQRLYAAADSLGALAMSPAVRPRDAAFILSVADTIEEMLNAVDAVKLHAIPLGSAKGPRKEVAH